MNQETYDALKHIKEYASTHFCMKYNHRKRLSASETWEKATMIRDLKQLNDWINEVAKEYKEV